MRTDDKVLIGLTHADDEPENVLIAYIIGVEALRADKQAALWLTKDGVHVARDGYVDDVVVDGAPSIAELHDEFIERGGIFIVCPVCVNLRELADETWVDNAEVAGAPRMFAFCEGGALVFNY